MYVGSRVLKSSSSVDINDLSGMFSEPEFYIISKSLPTNLKILGLMKNCYFFHGKLTENIGSFYSF